MKKVVNTSLSVRAKKIFEDVQDKGNLIEDAINMLHGKCPHCRKPWPKVSEQKQKVSVRINEKLANQLLKFSNVSKFISVAMNEVFDICPVCDQRKI